MSSCKKVKQEVGGLSKMLAVRSVHLHWKSVLTGIGLCTRGGHSEPRSY